MEDFLKELLFEYKNYAYGILFVWCLLEGEIALILGGILAHEGHINLALGIFIAGLGAFCGDQFYFYIGRYNRSYIGKKLANTFMAKSNSLDKHRLLRFASIQKELKDSKL